jgi:hypothetical protein
MQAALHDGFDLSFTADNAPQVHPVMRLKTPEMKMYRTQTVSTAKIPV